jgi:TetR/AcrR family transcriptional regulator, transcriptional repressor for nem operon
MKVTREQAAENREKILRAAARLFREKGFEGTAVAELMHDAGLTHGGFYGHFASKGDLAAKACEATLTRSAESWTRLADDGGDAALAALVENYLSEAHRDRPGSGCALSILGPEAARQEPPIRSALTTGLNKLIGVLQKAIPGRSEAAKREAALAAMAQLVGAVMLARMVDDRQLSDDILDAAKRDLVERTRV